MSGVSMRFVDRRDRLESGLDALELRRALPGAKQIVRHPFHFRRRRNRRPPPIRRSRRRRSSCRSPSRPETVAPLISSICSSIDRRAAQVAFRERIQALAEPGHRQHLRLGPGILETGQLLLADLLEFRLRQRRVLEDLAGQPQRGDEILARGADDGVGAGRAAAIPAPAPSAGRFRPESAGGPSWWCRG